MSTFTIRSAAAALLGCLVLWAPFARANPTPPPAGTRLTLINGWQWFGHGTAKPAAFLEKGVVHLKGAMMTQQASNEAFVMPPALRPPDIVYLKVDLCDATSGFLIIQFDGSAFVVAENGNFAKAQCLTSLDGVTYPVSTDRFRTLRFENGWTNYSESTGNAVVRNLGGAVRFAGIITTDGNNPVPFTLPATVRPSTTIYLSLGLAGGTNGQLQIDPDGTATIWAENDFGDAGLTSLDGVSYALGSAGFVSLDLINGWEAASSVAPAVKVTDKIVEFEGGITTTSDNSEPFVLPVTARPERVVYVPVDLCNAHSGRLVIQPDGSVSVEAETDFSNAQCLTSLDGVSFHL